MPKNVIGPVGSPSGNDPAFPAPQDPLKDRGALKQRARVIHREIPNISVQQGWAVADVRSGLVDLSRGLFDRPAQLNDAIASDSRVQSAFRSRSGGLLGRNIRFKIPARFKHDDRAKKCRKLWEEHWPHMEAEPALLDMLETSHSLGFSYSQSLWDTAANVWLPYLSPFNARFGYYDWVGRRHIAITQDEQAPITPGDGHWVLHAPYGQYRGWMRGAIRALAQWWLARDYALRDFARYCERHGFPILIADTPFGADTSDIAAYQAQLAGIGQESVLQVPGSVDVTKFGKYDLRYLEPKDDNWQAFKALIEQCNDEITLALLGQNLTSQVKEGSFAAARVHADVRQAILEADARALERTLYVQVMRPFAALNFGDADLAPLVKWDVKPPEDYETRAKTLTAFGQGLSALRMAGVKLKDPVRFARTIGLNLGEIEHVDPVQIEAQLARATGKADPNAQPNDDTQSEGDEDTN